jgi:DNA-binding NtrC family response regulator
MSAKREQIDDRVLIVAPIGRDAQATAQQLAEGDFYCEVCADIDSLHEQLGKGAGVALVTEEALYNAGTDRLKRWVATQPPWSDFPIIILTTRATSAAAQAHRRNLLESFGNVSMLERPLNAVTLLSTVRSALRARRRQYEVQNHLLVRETSAAHMEDLVRERTLQLEQANEQLRKQISERKQM